MKISKESIEYDTDLIKNELALYQDSSTLRRILYSYNFNNNYDIIKRKYDVNYIKPYELKSIEDFRYIFGYDIEAVDGYTLLNEEQKELFVELFCDYINVGGIQSRERYLASKISLDEIRKRFKIHHLDDESYAYLAFDGSCY